VVPVILFLRRKSNAMILCMAVMVMAIGAIHFTVGNMDKSSIPPLMRSFGIFDSKIDEASGGDASAAWRYAVWQSGWEKIMETPLTGKGFGNLPLNVETEDPKTSTDFERVLAGGEAHNGFVTAAYGFGIPFMVALCIALGYYFLKEAILALRADEHDAEMHDLHAFLAAMFASYPILIYTAFDLSSDNLWVYVAISCILSHLPRRETTPSVDAGRPLRKNPEEAGAPLPYSYRPR
jgi:O-antigen ligase